jgi:hypothetical protein
MDKRGAVGSGAAGGERVLPELFMAQRKDDAWGSRAMTTKATDEVRPKARTTDCSSRSSLARTTNSWATSATFSRPPGTCGSIRAVNGLYAYLPAAEAVLAPTTAAPQANRLHG